MITEDKVAKAMAIGVLSGVFEAVMRIVCAIGFSLANQLLVIGMGFAAGAMIYVVIEEIIPEHEKEKQEASINRLYTRSIHCTLPGVNPRVCAICILN